jgi:hypothetical protein
MKFVILESDKRNRASKDGWKPKDGDVVEVAI